MSVVKRLRLWLLLLAVLTSGCQAEQNDKPQEPPSSYAPGVLVDPDTRWWAGADGHSDSAITSSQIDWTLCATGLNWEGNQNPQPRTQVQASTAPAANSVRINAVVHTGAGGIQAESPEIARNNPTLRPYFWDETLGVKAPPKGFSDGLLVSVVPTAQWNGETHYLVPLVAPPAADNDRPAIRKFVPTCSATAFKQFAALPHYYSSVRLTLLSDADERSRKAQLEREFGHLVNAQLPFLSEPAVLASAKLPATMNSILSQVIRKEEARFARNRLSRPLTVRFLGLGKINVAFDVDRAQKGLLNILFDLDEPGSAALRDHLAQSPDWRLQCSENETQVPIPDTDQPARFYGVCTAPSPDASLISIPGFSPIVSDGWPDPVFLLRGRDLEANLKANLEAKLKIEHEHRYRSAEHADSITRQDADEDCADEDCPWKLRLSLFNEADGSLRLPLIEDGGDDQTLCPPVLRATVAQVIAGETVQASHDCEYTHLKWPVAWAEPRSGCIKTLKIDSNHLCRVERNAPVKLTWGGLVDDVALSAQETTPDDPRQPVDITERIRPQLPFLPDDPWMRQPGQGGADPCEAAPSYKVTAVRFLNPRDQAPATIDKQHELDRQDRLPSFAEIGWPTAEPLPTRIELTLKQVEPFNPAYTREDRFHWDPVADRTKNLKDWLGPEVRQSFPVVLAEQPQAPNGGDLSVRFFANEAQCRASAVGSETVSLDALAAGEVKRGPCDWARLFEVRTPASTCTRGSLDAEKQLEYRFNLLDCGTGRHLVLLAPTKALNSIGRGLQNRLTEQLERLRQQGATVPFDLLTLNAEQGLDHILRCEDLQNLEAAGPRSVRATIARLRFQADNLRALENLEPITADRAFPASRLQSILYITDGGLLPSLGDPDDMNDEERRLAVQRGIPSRLRAPILDWRDEGVRLRVLTTGSCDTWALMQADCVRLPEDPEQRLDFLSQEIGQSLGTQ